MCRACYHNEKSNEHLGSARQAHSAFIQALLDGDESLAEKLKRKAVFHVEKAFEETKQAFEVKTLYDSVGDEEAKRLDDEWMEANPDARPQLADPNASIRDMLVSMGVDVDAIESVTNADTGAEVDIDQTLADARKRNLH